MQYEIFADFSTRKLVLFYGNDTKAIHITNVQEPSEESTIVY